MPSSSSEAAGSEHSAWERVQLARHPERPHTLDYINRIFTGFQEVHGDRLFGDDPAIVAGYALFQGRPVIVIGQQKGRDTKQKLHRRRLHWNWTWGSKVGGRAKEASKRQPSARGQGESCLLVAVALNGYSYAPRGLLIICDGDPGLKPGATILCPPPGAEAMKHPGRKVGTPVSASRHPGLLSSAASGSWMDSPHFLRLFPS